MSTLGHCKKNYFSIGSSFSPLTSICCSILSWESLQIIYVRVAAADRRLDDDGCTFLVAFYTFVGENTLDSCSRDFFFKAVTCSYQRMQAMDDGEPASKRNASCLVQAL
jgi:hypothetical protein